MKQATVIRVLGLGLLCLLCTAALAQEFSADIVTTDKRQAGQNTKIYVSKNKMRMEGMGQKNEMGAVLVNYDTQMMDIIMPSRHMYMESNIGQGPGQRHNMFRFFQAIDVENACPDWQKMTDHPGGSCQRIGDDTANGRPAVKYAVTSAEGKNSTVWIDKSLKFPIKWQEQDSSGELQNIHEGPQPGALFEIPAGYQKFDMGNMMRQH
ncbi:MAG TPA: hypothetical protein VGG46_02180 [Terriglobales bacterium]